MNAQQKPLKGSIQDWCYSPPTNRVYGTHQGKDILTSSIVDIRVEGGIIVAETANSRYHLGNCP